ncbi:hypothetical protein ACEPAF_7576 [Sanghuangporus sanghuang]
MDDSDDYFQDSFQLDENDLAALDAAEAEYVASKSQIPARVSDSLPPQKRQKVSHGYSSDDILDVFLRADGTYGVLAGEQQDDGFNVAVPEGLFATRKESIACQVNDAVSSHVRSSQNLRERSLRRSSSCTFQGCVGQGSAAAVSEQICHEPHKATVSSNVRPTSDLRRELHVELVSLKSTVEMLKLENDRVKSALKDAEIARFAKEGEVTMLRKKVEKALPMYLLHLFSPIDVMHQAAQQHADNLVKLKEAKEAANLEQARIQKDMKQQIERLRTDYIFKQHEVDSSSRKPLLSMRTRRTVLDSQTSPVPVPPAMREWNATRTANPNKGNLIMNTPSMKGGAGENRGDSRVRTGVKLRPSVSEMKFPGFENSFLPSSPSNSPTRSRQFTSAVRNDAGVRTPTKSNKGKATDPAPSRARNGFLSPIKLPSLTFKPPADADFDKIQMDDCIQDFDVDIGPNDGSPRSRCKSVRTESSPTTDRGLCSAADLGFSDDMDMDIVMEGDIFEGINWSEELHYMLFSHISPVSHSLTFHFLLCADIADESYHRSCSAILEVLGAKYMFTILPKLMETVAENLIMMAVLLWGSDRFTHLRALFELLSTTMVYIPSFTEAILHAGFKGQSADSPLLRVFSEVILRSLDKWKDTAIRDEFVSLLHSMLTFLEGVAWTVSEDSYSSLVPLLQSDRVLLTLLDNKQPGCLISHAINALVVLASHPSIFQPILSCQNEDTNSEATKSNAKCPHRLPLLERLSSFLVDPRPFSSTETDELFSVVNFFALLVVQNSDGRTALLRSSTCIPCLVHYLSRLSATLWEDDELVMTSSKDAKSTVRNLKHALRLLHRLALCAPQDDLKTLDFDFRQKLFYVQHAMFNGLPHMFVVTIGRLSYADPPDWLDGELQTEIEKLTEPARDLMDLIVEGPESDSVWVAYQDSEGETVVENDDEIGARFIDIDEDT